MANLAGCALNTVPLNTMPLNTMLANTMLANTVLEVGLDSTGRSVLRRMHCEVPLVVRVDTACAGPGDPPGMLGLLVVNAAAGPLGGDAFTLTLTLDDGAAVRVRSVGASMVHPGRTGSASSAVTRLTIGHGATLDWELEPTVSIVGSDHHVRTVIEASSSATVRVVDSVSLGRYREPSGVLAVRQRLVIDGAAVLDHETVFGPGAASGPGAQGPLRTIRSEVIVDDAAPTASSSDVGDGWVRGVFPLAPRCALISAAGAGPGAGPMV